MDEEERQNRISRAIVLLREIHHVPVSTVNRDGSPHASPVLMAFDKDLHGFWASNPESMHSQNIARESRVFMPIFDSRGGHGGLFLSGQAEELTDYEKIQYGLVLLDHLKKELYGDGMADIADYMQGGNQRIYRFLPEHAWINHSERQGGAIVRDKRYEIPLEELIVS